MSAGSPFDPFAAAKTQPGDRWAELFAKPKATGVLRKSKARSDSSTSSSEKAGDIDLGSSEPESQPSVKAGAHLSNPRWEGREGFFNEKFCAAVDGELDLSIAHLTKVSFTLFSKVPGGEAEQLEVKEAHLKGGVARAEFTLWIPSYRDEAGYSLRKGEYFFIAKHRKSDEVKSGLLPVSVRSTAFNHSARELKRGVRGEDVLGWQRFLLRIRRKVEFQSSIPEITEDGIFGWETRTATVAFQSKVGLELDGIVGPKTREQAELLGAEFQEAPASGMTPMALNLVRSGKLPLFPIRAGLGISELPASPKGSSREESWKRLRAEAWKKSDAIKKSLESADAVVQSVEDGSGDYLYDEYKVSVALMPPGVEPEALLEELATSLNRTVQNPEFDFINTFNRRSKANPKAGELVDIDIMGPDDGTVILGEMGRTYFIYQTVDCPETWSHPENGSREFGFQWEGASVLFYTRGLSRPGNFIIGMLGAEPQRRGWTALMQGISSRINALGGKSEFSSFGMLKERRKD